MNEQVETRNALIEHTFLGVEDHGLMTLWLHLSYGSSGQGAGGYALDTWVGPHDAIGRRVGTAVGCDLILRVLTTLGVSSWEELPGQRIRVQSKSNKVVAIGHFLDDKWLDIEAYFAEWKGRE